MNKEIIALVLVTVFGYVNAVVGLALYVVYGLLMGWDFPIRAAKTALEDAQKWVDSKVEAGEKTSQCEEAVDEAKDVGEEAVDEGTRWDYYNKDLSEADKKLIGELIALGGRVVGSRRIFYRLTGEGGLYALQDVAYSYFAREKRDVDMAFPNESLARAAAALIEKAAKDGIEVEIFAGYAKQPYNPAIFRKVFSWPSAKIDVFVDESFSLRDEWVSWVERHPSDFERISKVAWEFKMEYGKEWQPPF